MLLKDNEPVFGIKSAILPVGSHAHGTTGCDAGAEFDLFSLISTPT